MGFFGLVVVAFVVVRSPVLMMMMSEVLSASAVEPHEWAGRKSCSRRRKEEVGCPPSESLASNLCDSEVRMCADKNKGAGLKLELEPSCLRSAGFFLFRAPRSALRALFGFVLLSPPPKKHDVSPPPHDHSVPLDTKFSASAKVKRKGQRNFV